MAMWIVSQAMIVMGKGVDVGDVFLDFFPRRNTFRRGQLGSIEVNLFNNGVIETVDINHFNAPKSIDMVNSNAF